jgi:hypothetical protein
VTEDRTVRQYSVEDPPGSGRVVNVRTNQAPGGPEEIGTGYAEQYDPRPPAKGPSNSDSGPRGGPDDPPTGATGSGTGTATEGAATVEEGAAEEGGIVSEILEVLEGGAIVLAPAGI